MTTLAMATHLATPAWVALTSGPLFGCDPVGGYHTAGDLLVSHTADGVSLEKLRNDLRDLLGIWRERQDALTSLLAFSQTTHIAEAIPQTLAKFACEEPSEFGVPKAGRAGDSLLIGYDFRDYARASHFT